MINIINIGNLINTINTSSSLFQFLVDFLFLPPNTRRDIISTSLLVLWTDIDRNTISLPRAHPDQNNENWD